MDYSIFNANCLSVLSSIRDVDAVICDPPYGLSFMGKGWDHGVPGVEFWEAIKDSAKPGAHLLAFGGTRTFHRLACAIEDAGWEIRDCIMWVYGTGFPKSLDVSKAIDKASGAEREAIGYDASKARPNKEGFAKVTSSVADRSGNSGHKDNGATLTAPATDAAKKWNGWGTALKPAWEPIIVARKPLIGTVADNVMQHGTGAINIDGCRIPTSDKLGGGAEKSTTPEQKGNDGWTRPWMENEAAREAHAARIRDNVARAESLGRFPANVIHDGSDEVVELFPGSNGSGKQRTLNRGKRDDGWGMSDAPGELRDAGSGSASRFFYCAKASKSDRGEGNNHPTVKPTSLMRYLCKLVTPPGGTVLDPFMGSGSTGVAAIAEGFSFIGIDESTEYCEISNRRLSDACHQ